MDSLGALHCTVPLMRCDDTSQIPLLNTNVIKNVNTVSVDPKATDVSSKTTELKRSARLSRKRLLQDNPDVIEIADLLDDSNEGGKVSKILKSNKTKSDVTPKIDIKKCNNRDSAMFTITSASSQPSDVSNVQPSLNTVIADNGEKMRVKSLSRVYKNKNLFKPPVVTADVKNVSAVFDVDTEDLEHRLKREKIEDFLAKLTRKRGRPSHKEVQLLFRDADKVNTSSDDEVDRWKTGNGFPEPTEKSLDESESTTLNENDRTAPMPESDDDCDYGPSKPKMKRIGIKSSTANVKIVIAKGSCPSEDVTEPVKAVSTATFEHDEVSPDANESQPPRDERFDREIALVSNRFNIPLDTLRNIIEKESLSVFREKFSDKVTLSMITVSPVVSMTINNNNNKGKRKSGRNSNGTATSDDVTYKIEPIRESAAYGKTNLKDAMEEISKSMPSWTLSIVDGPPRYVISHMSIEKYGTPVANKSVVLDRFFRASVYVNQNLEYKYCKRYTTASEIVNLIKELDAI